MRRVFGRTPSFYLCALATLAMSAIAGGGAHATLGTCDTAGPIEVEATGGDPGPTAYANVGAAFAAINAGTHTDAINVEVCANSPEGGPAVLNSSGAGSASYTSLSIQPLADGLTISGATATGRGLIELNGADNVTIDGDNPNSGGTNRDLTITNTAASTITFTSVVRLALSTMVTSANGNTVRNCNINGSATGRNISTATSTSGSEATTYGILVGGGASTVAATTAPNAITSLTTTIASGQTVTSFTADNNLINAAARALTVQGAAVTVANLLSITNNVIGSAAAGDTTTVYGRGILACGFDNTTIRGNTIRNMAWFAGTQLMGLVLGDVSTTGQNALVENNQVINLNNRNTITFGAYGINVNAGNNNTVQNNFVAGVQGDMTGGAAFSTTFGLFGIRVGSGTGNKIYHNSVSMFGLRSGTANSSLLTAAFGITTTGATILGADVRNNIFSNTISGGTTSIAHVAVYLPTSGTTANLNLTWNNNAYYTGSTAGVHGVAHVGTTYTAVPAGPATWAGLYTAANFSPAATTPNANFRAYTSTLSAAGTNDNASFATTSAAPYVSSTDLHLNTGLSNTPLESGGASVGVTVDIDGDTRPGPLGSVNGGATAPDLGADEFDGVPLLANDIAANAFVDPVSGGTKLAGSPFSPQASFSNLGTATQTSVTVRYRILDAGSFEVYNDAQVIASIAPASTTTVTFSSANLSAGSYTIKARSELAGDQATGNDEITGTLIAEPPLCGNYDVGSGGAFASLTNALGAFAKLNSVGATCDVSFSIVSDLSGETGAVPLNSIAGDFAVLIQPVGGVRTISGTSAASSGLIILNGVDNVTIEGSLSPFVPSQDMTITNSAASGVCIWIRSAGPGNGSNGHKIKNLRLNGASGTSTIAGVLAGGPTFGSASEAPNSNNRIQNSIINKVQNAAFISGNATNLDQNWEISGNTFGSTVAAEKLGFRGMLIGGSQDFVISGNTINGVVSSTTTSSTMTGIQLSSVIAGGTIRHNKISDIKQINTTGWGSNGLFLASSSTTANVLVYNNFIWDVASQGFNGIDQADNGYGIVVASGGGYKLYNNSVHLTTNQVAVTGNTAGLNVLAAVTTVGAVDLRNNIFSSVQTVGTRYGVLNAAAVAVFSTIDYNDYSAQNVGRQGATTHATLAAWQGSTGQDANSKAVVPGFVSNTDLHLSVPSPMENAGVDLLEVADDIDSDLRQDVPEIGADEVDACLGVDCTGSNTVCGTASCDPAGLSGNCDTLTPVAAGPECRASTAPCDPAEACNGTDTACPADIVNPNAPLGDTLTLSKSGTDATITWTEVDPGPFNVYRGFRDPGPWSYNHTCFDPGVAGPTSVDTDVPPTGRTLYYLISRVADPCTESSLGFGTPGERPNDSPCPGFARDFDFDGDDVVDALDNCVGEPNVEQLDADNDGRGDACDCPEAPCP